MLNKPSVGARTNDTLTTGAGKKMLKCKTLENEEVIFFVNFKMKWCLSGFFEFCKVNYFKLITIV